MSILTNSQMKNTVRYFMRSFSIVLLLSTVSRVMIGVGITIPIMIGVCLGGSIVDGIIRK